MAADVAEVRPLLLVNAFDVVPQTTLFDESPTTNDANELRRRRCRSRRRRRRRLDGVHCRVITQVLL